MRTRVYVVLCPNGDKRLIDAASSAQAIRHVVKNKYSAHVAGQADFVEAMKGSLVIEYANRENASETVGEQLEFNLESNGNQPNEINQNQSES